jgi:hypothetical protein
MCIRDRRWAVLIASPAQYVKDVREVWRKVLFG